MQNEVLDLITREKSQNTENVEKIKKNVWLIFTMGEKKYAVQSEKVKEILRDAEIFPLPFAPVYLNGVVNRYGDPYAVIDPAILIDETPQNTLLFFVLNDDSHTCLRITDVKDFYTADEDALIHFSQTDLCDYFEGTLKINGEDALVLNVNYFLERLGNDIGA